MASAPSAGPASAPLKSERKPSRAKISCKCSTTPNPSWWCTCCPKPCRRARRATPHLPLRRWCVTVSRSWTSDPARRSTSTAPGPSCSSARSANGRPTPRPGKRSRTRWTATPNWRRTRWCCTDGSTHRRSADRCRPPGTGGLRQSRRMNLGYILNLSCPDRPGIVHAVSGFLLEHGGNIEEAAQYNDHGTGLFFMRVQFACDRLGRADLQRALHAFAEPFAMRWQPLEHRRAPLGIIAGDDLARRLVVDEDARARGREAHPHDLAVDSNLVLGADLLTDFGRHPVHR